jgi:hypothetical protein
LGKNGVPFTPNIIALELKQLAKKYIKETSNLRSCALQKKDTKFYLHFFTTVISNQLSMPGHTFKKKLVGNIAIKQSFDLYMNS